MIDCPQYTVVVTIKLTKGSKFAEAYQSICDLRYQITFIITFLQSIILQGWLIIVFYHEIQTLHKSWLLFWSSDPDLNRLIITDGHDIALMTTEINRTYIEANSFPDAVYE